MPNTGIRKIAQKMKQTIFNRREVLKFRRFSRKGYALFSCLGKVVLIGTLSVATLAHAKADGISTRQMTESDTLSLTTDHEVGLEEVLVTASRSPITLLESAKMVSVISRDDIARAEAESVSDLLKMTTGADVRQRGGFGVQTDISLCGGTFDQTVLLLNGLPLESPQTGHNAADFPVSVDDIERIEILEGGAARLTGASAFSGAVNVITRKSDTRALTLQAQGGSFGSFSTEASLSFPAGQTSHRLSGGYGQSDGGTIHSDFHLRRAFYSGQWQRKRVSMDWQTGIVSKDYGANTFYSVKYDNQFEATRRYLASVSARILLLDNNLKANGFRWELHPLIYGHRDMDHYQLVRGMSGAEYGENLHRTDVYGVTVDNNLTWWGGKTSVGVDLRKEKILSTAYGDLMSEDRWKSISGSRRMYDKRAERTNTNIFLEHNILIGRWSISAGLLANRNTGLDRTFRYYPGADIAWRPKEGWKLYLSWNKALRMPTFTDLYTGNAVQQGDAGLLPERNDTYKTGVTYHAEGWQGQLGAFYMYGKNLIDWVYENETSTRYHAMNIGRLENFGLSAEVSLFSGQWWGERFPVRTIRLGYAYIHQTHETSEPIWKSLYALEYLRHKLVIGVDHRVWRRLSASWALRWQERMNGYHPYTKIDVKMTWDAGKWQVFLKGDNLTCHRYYDLGGVLQPGLWMMGGAKITLE